MKGTKPTLRLPKNPVMKAPKVPAWFSKYAKSEWKRIWPDLLQRKTITEADMGSLENFCVASGQVRECEVMIAAEGPVIMTPRGPRAHPAVKIQADAMNRARLLAAELGLTPVSRSRPSVRDDEDAEDDLLSI